MESRVTELSNGHAITHVGCVRAANEDSILLRRDEAHECLLAVVADGMGGHKGGATASSTAVSLFDAGWSLLQSGASLSTSLLAGTWLTRIAQLAHEAIRTQAQQEPELNNMGTTLVAVAMCGLRACVAHIGDSRAYCFSEGVLLPLTRDHSLVQRMVDDGVLSESEAERSPLRNYLTRSLGGGDVSGQPDISTVTLKHGDRLLLCSDGLYNMLNHDELVATLSAYQSDADACQQLLEQALVHGATDNVSIIVFTANGGGVEMALLAQVVDGVVVSKFPLDKQRHIIGRHAKCDITIDDVSVSSQHAAIESRENSYLEGYCDYVLLDLSSTNGTFVNDEKITEQRLMNGDLVRIAWNTFRFVDDNEFDLEKTTKILAGAQF